MKRNAARPVIELDTGTIALASAEKPSPALAWALRRPLRSDNRPARQFSDEPEKSARSSINPSSARDATATVVKPTAYRETRSRS